VLPLKRALVEIELLEPLTPPKVELCEAEALKRELATFETPRFVENEEEVEREAELIAAERPEPEPIFGAPLFIAIFVEGLLEELPKERKLAEFVELRALAFPVPPPEFPNECHPGEVFA
jgi:hypothetical protein